jgi:signal transduction histidine kinase
MLPEPSDSKALQERLALLDKLRQIEIRATGLRVASVVGHLIGTPLNVIVGRAALIRNDPSPELAVENARKIEDQVAKLTQRIRRLIEYLNPADLVHAPRNASELVAEALDLYGPIAQSNDVNLELLPAQLSQQGPERRVADGVATQVVLTSLLSMAVRAARAGATIQLRTEASEDTCTFEIDAPGLVLPKGRIDSMEPPEDPDPAGAEHLPVLSVCSAMVRRLDGQLQIEALGPAHARLRFSSRLSR